MALATTHPPLSWSHNACDLTLAQLIDEGRDAFVSELDIPMITSTPQPYRSRDAHGETVVEKTEPVGVGLPLSPQLYRRIHHPDHYGNVFPMARALDDLRGWCRGRHIEAASGPWEDHLVDVTMGPELQRPRCARLAWYVIGWRMTPAWAARQERLSFHGATRLLTKALQHIYEQRREWAHSDGSSGVPQVLADLRKSRRAARARAVASRVDSGVRCRHCGGPYDVKSTAPCPGSNDLVDVAVAAAVPGGVLLCAPAAGA